MLGCIDEECVEGEASIAGVDKHLPGNDKLLAVECAGKYEIGDVLWCGESAVYATCERIHPQSFRERRRDDKVTEIASSRNDRIQDEVGEGGEGLVDERGDGAGEVFCVESHLAQSPLALSVHSLELREAEAIVEARGLDPELVSLRGIRPENVAYMGNLDPALLIVFSRIKSKARRTGNEMVEERGESDAGDGFMARVVEADSQRGRWSALSVHFDEGLVVAVEDKGWISLDSLTASHHGVAAELRKISSKAKHAIELRLEPGSAVRTKECNGENVGTSEQKRFPTLLTVNNRTDHDVMTGGRWHGLHGYCFVCNRRLGEVLTEYFIAVEENRAAVWVDQVELRHSKAILACVLEDVFVDLDLSGRGREGRSISCFPVFSGGYLPVVRKEIHMVLPRGMVGHDVANIHIVGGG